jgi:hypothetical protein
MAFGFGVGDIIALANLSLAVYNGWKKAPREYDDLQSELRIFHNYLCQVKSSTDFKHALERASIESRHRFEEIIRACTTTIKECEELLYKVKPQDGRGWLKRAKLMKAMINVEKPVSQLGSRKASLHAMYDALIMQDMQQSLQDIKHRLQAGNETVSSVWSEYGNDRKRVWKDFLRPALIRDGHGKVALKKYGSRLMTQFIRLAESGELDEQHPSQDVGPQ